MDFKRIMLMLTLFFLIFDIYLGFRVYQQVQSTTIRQSDFQQQSIEQRLQARDITLLSPLNEEEVEGTLIKTEENSVLRDGLNQLTHQQVNFSDENVLTATFDEPLNMEGQITPETSTLPSEVAKFIRDQYLLNDELFIEGGAYTQYWYLPTNRTIVFWMTAINNTPIVDGSAEIKLQLDENYNIASYTQTYQHNFVTLDEDKPYKLITAREAIEVLDTRIQTNLPSNSTIIHVTLCYIKYKEWDEINIYLPVWNVVYQRSEGQTGSMLVDAIKGQVMER
ncbi:two-component system regulatory protein YycI [Globicatella sanguinis]|uniref:two-component system regulatory protein YycI n=1 Tax=Globicatella sanguinis TaxID=13076 RepID=UPI0025429E09|nr:two-component system regulatory protein YycI [Globicatella sanguinis]MDK7629870.1 two-component system regulatory protein YycI [Globicatella sanguinis]WIK65771.1 two-component system regulatory protein YycI [Globicatella sanguinis]WKT55176.1 two-component system regulatory protein YycI [Globicatella sanguinis]